MIPPKVSVIIPVYNVAAFIERCARSLFGQTFEDIEFIFVDDCSPDDSIIRLKSVLQEFPERHNQVRILRHAKNRGLAAARNTGLMEAHGEFIQHIDSDDFVETDMIAVMYAKAQTTGADIVVTDFIFDWGNSQKLCNQIFSENSVEYTNLLLSGRVLPGVVNKLIRKSLYTDNGIMAIEGLNIGEDYVTTPRLACFARKIAKVSQPLYHYVQINQAAYTKTCGHKTVVDLTHALEILVEFFSARKDYVLYQQSILQGQLKKKTSLLASAPKELRSQIGTLFPDSNAVSYANIFTSHEKTIFRLAKRKLFRLLDIYLYGYNVLFEALQIVKGRR